MRRQIDKVRPGIGEFDFKAGGKVPRKIQLGIWRVWRADVLDEDISKRILETVSIEAKVNVDVVLEKSMPSALKEGFVISNVTENILVFG